MSKELKRTRTVESGRTFPCGHADALDRALRIRTLRYEKKLEHEPHRSYEPGLGDLGFVISLCDSREGRQDIEDWCWEKWGFKD